SLFVIDNCGHVVNVEQPERFNNHTIGFINSLAV
ncbi:MAG: alpha/beta hydrolase, partial [Polaribacter sp.]